MIPRGLSSAMREAGSSWRTIWQKTFCSRTRRAMSCPYWAPKSKIRMRSFSGNGVMGSDCGYGLILVYVLVGMRFFLRPQGEQFLKHRFVVDFSIAAIAF